jgi:hypothetical protein
MKSIRPGLKKTHFSACFEDDDPHAYDAPPTPVDPFAAQLVGDGSSTVRPLPATAAATALTAPLAAPLAARRSARRWASAAAVNVVLATTAIATAITEVVADPYWLGLERGHGETEG